MDEARAEYRRAIELNPTALSAPYHIAKIESLLGNYAAAETAYKAMIARMPSYFLGYAGLGRLYYEHGHFSDAAVQFQKLNRSVPDNPMGYQGPWRCL